MCPAIEEQSRHLPVSCLALHIVLLPSSVPPECSRTWLFLEPAVPARDLPCLAEDCRLLCFVHLPLRPHKHLPLS